MNTKDLENRVIDFAVSIVNIVEEIKNNYAGNYYGNQVIPIFVATIKTSKSH